MKKYLFSGGDEFFDSDEFDTREAALTAAREMFGDSCSVFTCVKSQLTFNDLKPRDLADLAIDRMVNNLSDFVEEAAERWSIAPDLEENLQAELESVIEQWLSKNKIWPNVFIADQVCEHKPDGTEVRLW